MALTMPAQQLQARPPCIASSVLRGLRIALSSTQDEAEAVSGTVLTAIPPAAAEQGSLLAPARAL